MDTTGRGRLLNARGALRAIAAFALAGVMASCGGGDQASSHDARDEAQAATIQTRGVWNPAVFHVTVLQGTSQLSSIQLTVTQQVDDASLFVVPAIAGLVQVSLSGQTVLSPGVPISVPMELSVPASTAPGLYEGTVHLRSGRLTLPANLRVQIEVVQGSSNQIVNQAADPSPDRVGRLGMEQFLIRDEVVVVLRGDVADLTTRITEIAGEVGAVIIGSVPGLPVYQLRFVGADVDNLPTYAAAIRQLAGVESASFNLLGAGLKVPDDKLFANQWSPVANGINRSLEFIRAPEAWDLTTGYTTDNKKPLVAVIDDDFDYKHADLANNILKAPQGDPFTFSPWQIWPGRGHGTGVAGTLCAEGDNGFGVVGVAWHCSLLLYPAKSAFIDVITGVAKTVLTCIGKCAWLASLTRTLDSMKKAVDDGAKVVNISIGMVEPNCKAKCSSFEAARKLAKQSNDVLKKGVEYSVTQGKQVLWIFAAGNEGHFAEVQSPASLKADYPAYADRLIVVAGVDVKDGAADDEPVDMWIDSNYGSLIDVAAPVAVSATWPRYCDPAPTKCDDVTKITSLPTENQSSYLWPFGGTSAAAPQVAGVAVLVLSRYPDKTASEVRTCILNGATAGVTLKTFRVINAAKAVECSINDSAPIIPAAQPRDVAIEVGQTATFSVTATSAATPTYQWRRGVSDIGGATSASYTTPTTTLADNGAIYSVVVTNTAGAAVSRSAVLTVTSPVVGPTIVAPPQSTAVTEGAKATFNVSATGSTPLSYQWRKNGLDVSCVDGTNCPTYTTPITTLSDNGARFSVTVSNGAGSMTSADALLTVNSLVAAPVVSSVSVDPSSPVVGSLATFSVNGTNLQSGYTLSLPGCAATELASGSTTQRQFVCTLTVAGSNLTGTVTVPSGTAIYSFVVTVGTAPPPPQAALSIGLGYAHTCGVTAAGVLKCWGNNSGGELGDGTFIQRITPVTVLGLEQGVVAVASGPYHACALTSLGGVKCWGANAIGQLGDGTQTRRLSPVDVSGLGSGVIAISVGTDHTCAIIVGGGVKCWGGHGPEVGAPIFTSHFTPVDVPGLSSGVTAIALGHESSCALTSAGGVKCWGYNNTGQIGGGDTYQSAPFDIAGLSSNVIAIDAGYEHFCALTSAGGVKCWGDNFFGKLGNGAPGVLLPPSSTPVDVVGLTQGVVSVAAGDNETCAVTSAGGVMCWGDDGTGTRVRSTPVAVVALSTGVARVDVGSNHVCAVITAGGLKCWQANNLGQVGDGTSNNYRLSPVDVVGF